ncbi:MAG: protein-L-isoaspartate(D-aspartate) O-methyltransferase [Pseudomonadales bacterium]|nr:protein-L-isoaspartate(D-aspartate) O-methyltransferase [Pseudomonadales bacterium]
MNSIRQQGIGMTSQRTRERLVQRLMEQGIRQVAVLEAIRTTPRHLFIDEALAHRAYEDVSLPIGFGQTISQPYIVARMTEIALAGRKHVERVLEIGTGCGYQAAILSRLVSQVYSIERINPLLSRARKRFQDLGLKNISARLGDGNEGWPEHAPYDAIIAAAVAPEAPPELLRELAEGGVLVMPVGDSLQQELRTYTRQRGEIIEQALEPVRFVPLLDGVVRQ